MLTQESLNGVLLTDWLDLGAAETKKCSEKR